MKVKFYVTIPAITAIVFVDDKLFDQPRAASHTWDVPATPGQTVHVIMAGGPVSQCTLQFGSGKVMTIKSRGIRSRIAK